MNALRGLATILLLIAVGCSAGCLAVAAGAAAGTGVAYARGSLEANFAATVPEVMSASRAALEDMGIAIVSEEVSAVDGEIIARTARDDRVRIRATSEGPDVTSLSIRIGTFGDRERSTAIYDRIRENLPRR